jgi:hypothetical protein
MRSPPALALLFLTLVLPSLAHAVTINGGFDSGTVGWNFAGDFSVETGSYGPPGDPKLVLTTAPDSQPPLGTGAVAPTAITTLLGITATELADNDPDSTPGGIDAFEGSAATQQFVVGSNASLSFEWQIFTDETTFGTPFPDFLLFHVHNLAGTFSVTQLVTDLLSESVNGNLSPSPTPYDSQTVVNSLTVALNGPDTYIMGFAIFDVTDNHFDTAVAIDNVTLVPEPSGVALATSALLALGAARGRARRSSQATR